MVARTPPKLHHQRKMVVPPLNPILLRQTLIKVDKCMARLQELQYTVTGGNKVISGVTLSPRSTRGYLKTSIRCKQESLRIKNATSNRSPNGKLPTNAGEWKRMSLPAMILGETVGEILQASQFARKIVEATVSEDPKTPLTMKQNKKQTSENSSELRARRKREKRQVKSPNGRSESNPRSLQCARSRINFKVSPLHKRECEGENCKYIANRVSPRHRPWARKTVLFPNPLFHSSSPTSQNKKLGRTESAAIARTQQRTPHKFLIKSPNQNSKFQVKIRSPPLCISPTRGRGANKSPKNSSSSSSTAAKLRRSFSPSRLANRLISSPSKMRRSFSPSKLANKLVSPLKSRKTTVQQTEAMKSRKTTAQQTDAMKMMMSGLKQRPSSSSSVPMQFPARRL